MAHQYEVFTMLGSDVDYLWHPDYALMKIRERGRVCKAHFGPIGSEYLLQMCQYIGRKPTSPVERSKYSVPQLERRGGGPGGQSHRTATRGAPFCSDSPSKGLECLNYANYVPGFLPMSLFTAVSSLILPTRTAQHGKDLVLMGHQGPYPPLTVTVSVSKNSAGSPLSRTYGFR